MICRGPLVPAQKSTSSTVNTPGHTHLDTWTRPPVCFVSLKDFLLFFALYFFVQFVHWLVQQEGGGSVKQEVNQADRQEVKQSNRK